MRGKQSSPSLDQVIHHDHHVQGAQICREQDQASNGRKKTLDAQVGMEDTKTISS